MNSKIVVALVVALFVGLAGLAADAQDAKAPKGVKTKGLVTSLGGFSATVNAPIFVSGATVELEPGGQTGRQQFRVPTYIYVLEGVLTTDYEAGPVGTKGVQYHATGQSFMDPGGVWHNHMNTTDRPLKYVRLHIGYPGAATVQTPEPE
jgi:quercetin dioxygenase-like cupin family protein